MARYTVWLLAWALGASASCSSCLSTVSPSTSDQEFLRCCACHTPEVLLGLSDTQPLCGEAPAPPGPLIAQALYNIGEMQGHWWLDDAGDMEANATDCLSHLISYLPKRDALVLFAGDSTYRSLEFLAETVRLALAHWPRLRSAGVPWSVFLDGVLPFAVLNEKRDYEWRWRPRLQRLFASAWTGAGNNITLAMYNLTAMIPTGAADYLSALIGRDGSPAPQPGQVIQWHSSVSPGFLSPQQVASAFGSCTGTGIVLVAAARAIGIPARLAGCSQTDVPGDDHHWVEFYDPSSPGPFGTPWHTKEGTSKGNEGGPWDSPSGPMMGCLRGVVPGSSLNTLWAASWSSPVYLPTLWASDGPLTGQQWSFVGGENVCGDYCSAWGCGANSSKWNQSACGPTAGWRA